MKIAEDNSYSANLEKARRITTNCLKQKKVYCIQGCYPVVRRMLEKYDYVEKDWRHTNDYVSTFQNLKWKIDSKILRFLKFLYQPEAILTPKKNKPSDDQSFPRDDDLDQKVDYKQLDDDLVEYAQEIKDFPINSTKTMCARLLKDEVCNFFWIIRSTGFHIKSLSKDQIVNHFPGASFTTKSGIADILSKHLMWSCDRESTEFFPRCYKLSCPDDRKFFLKDYKITTALATLKILTSFTETPNQGCNFSR